MGSTFASSGERHPDPLKDLLQAATATQVCRFYYQLAYGRLINTQRSTQMLQVLSNPGLHDKFVSVLEQSISPDRIFRKNGTFGTTHCDSVLVWGEGWRRYILVGLVEDAQGEQILGTWCRWRNECSGKRRREVVQPPDTAIREN